MMPERSPKLGLIAGGGDLPGLIAAGAESLGREIFILGVKGFVEEELLQNREGVVLSIGETGAQLKALKKAGVEELCFAGIVKRPNFKSLSLDARGVSILPKVIAAASRGDDALLRAVLNVFEKEGFRIVGADEVLESVLAKPGPATNRKPTAEQLEDLVKAARTASEIGRLDIGQGAVVCRGLVLAVEAQEGTDEMLKRCAALPLEIRGGSDKPEGVLVKRPKPQQERRIDLPTIGLNTIRLAADAGLAGVGVEAGAALVLDGPELILEAEDRGVWIYAFTPSEIEG